MLRIRALSATKGYLENAPVELAPGLTCIIGARGTCKSTLVETIRFLFDSDRKRVGLLLGKRDPDAGPDAPAIFGLIKATLGAGTAKADLDEDGPLAIERDVDSDAPRVTRDGIRDQKPAILDRIEIYSQGDLQRIAEDGGRRLELIDRPHRARIEGLAAQRREAAQKLRDIGSRLRATRARIEARAADLKTLAGLDEQLSQLSGKRPALSPALDRERQGFHRRKGALKQTSEVLSRREEILDFLRGLGEDEDEVRALVQDLRALDASSELAGALASFADLLASARTNAVSQSAQDTTALVEKLRASFEERDRAYLDLQKQQEDASDTLKTEDRLRQQVAQLDEAAAELEKLRKSEVQLLEERRARRAEIAKAGDAIYALRLEEVERMNARFEGVIVLGLLQGTRSNDYRAALDRVLQGSRLQRQGEIARDLAAKVPPWTLVDAIETGDAALLAEMLGRDRAQMSKLIAFLLDSPALHDLDAVSFEDQLEISMFVEGVAKPVQNLSKGQMATALLPLVLREAPYPLIFDQPEDDLDNRFVYQTLVARIRELKATRQLVFVTHNANIPVLGDADRVVVMHMESPTKAAPPIAGSVEDVKDHILALLEGGAEAFKERKKRYGKLVK